MRLYLDTNVALALFVEGEATSADALELIALADEHDIELVMDASQMTDIGYMLRPNTKRSTFAAAPEAVLALCDFCDVLSVDVADIREATTAPLAALDFEDALRAHMAAKGECDILATQNLAHFESSTVPALSIGAAIEMIQSEV